MLPGKTLVCFTLLGVMSAAAPAHAFNAPGHKWPAASYPVHYRFEPSGAPGISDGSDLEASRRAFATWQTVACSEITFEEKEWMAPAQIGNDGVNRIFWATERSQFPGQPATLALTYTFYQVADGVVTDADIVSNGVDWTWTTDESMVASRRVDIETVMFHEIGHYFGLDHSTDPGAAMFAQNNVPVRRMPANDDIAGICTLYPNGMTIPGASNPSEPGSVGAPCQTNENCASLTCIDDTEFGQSYCTQMCSRTTPGDCPVDFPCTETSQGNFCLAPLQVDELCDQCSTGAQCATGLCVEVPNYNSFQPFCTRACDPTPGGPANCPSGYRCEVVQQGGQTGGVCAPNTGVCNPTGRGGHNEPCFTNGACKPGHTCVQYFQGSSLNFCYLECTPALVGLSCSSQRLLCSNIDSNNAFGRMNIAACLTIASVGAPCIPEVCEAGAVCAFDENRGIDSAICYGTCPTGQCQANEQCVGFPGLGPVCVPNAGFKPLGDTCNSSSECRSNACRTFGEVNLCTQNCATSDRAGCPDGFKCLAATGEVMGLCWSGTSFVPEQQRLGMSVPGDDGGGRCACDSTSLCDSDFATGKTCECDPNCTGTCSCTTTETSGSQPSLLLSLLLLFVYRLRRVYR